MGGVGNRMGDKEEPPCREHLRAALMGTARERGSAGPGRPKHFQLSEGTGYATCQQREDSPGVP